MIKVETKSGFKCEIDENIMNDYEFFEIISELEENPLVLPKAIKGLLGEQEKDLKNHIRDEKGKVATDSLMREMEDIFNQIKELKN